MKRALPLLAFAALACTAVSAQTRTSMTAATDADYINTELSKGKGLSTRSSTAGSPFLFHNWTSGQLVSTVSGPRRALLKYDLAQNRLLVRKPNGDSVEVMMAQVKEFTLGDSARGERYTFRLYPDVKTEKPTLRSTLWDVRYDAGSTALLRQRTRTVYSYGNSPSLAGSTGSAWRDTYAYYIKRTDNTLVPVRLNTRSVLEALGKAQAPALQAYINQQRLKLDDEADVAKLLAYFDTL
ncbi:hypothetical protein [Solirubrum puertoriconensis]|uniref:Uncharacterized protein n=1 Tax=Solirubrum puertoriconensis TaxID=1751427 RepID=A0A9X0HM93_SOLP1|nr:hypothetical protein [Solirubrum puertoriconensis]KUG08575.1 hypothetical protein ASU33_10500 [Solirubrum puertoriconensis]